MPDLTPLQCTVFRLYRGPYATRADAQDALRDLPAALNFKPLVIKR